MRSDVSHFLCNIVDGVATVSLDRPERKSPLTFESYAELRDWFRDLHYDDEVKVVVFAPDGGNFSSGGDVHDIIGPLTKMSMKKLLTFTRMTGDLVKSMINCGKLIISAVDGFCAGAGPNFANMMTKTMLAQEWSIGLEQAIEAEAQAICMQGQDFHRAHHAFVAKEKPVFEGN